MTGAGEQRAEMLWRSYFQDGTQVLRNDLGITDADELRVTEYEYAAARQQQIADGEVVIEPTFDDRHLAALHRHLFGDVYAWAGQPRVVDIAKGGVNFAATPEGVAEHLWAAKVATTRTDWAGVDAEGFAAAMGAVYAEINYAHPFREGNGRAAKLMLDQLAERSPFRLEWDRISSEEWNQAAAASVRAVAYTGHPDPGALVPVFRGLTVARQPTVSAGAPAQGWGLVEQAYAVKPGRGGPRTRHGDVGATRRPRTPTVDRGTDYGR